MAEQYSTMCIPHLINPFICQWTSFPCLGLYREFFVQVIERLTSRTGNNEANQRVDTEEVVTSLGGGWGCQDYRVGASRYNLELRRVYLERAGTSTAKDDAQSRDRERSPMLFPCPLPYVLLPLAFIGCIPMEVSLVMQPREGWWKDLRVNRPVGPAHSGKKWEVERKTNHICNPLFEQCWLSALAHDCFSAVTHRWWWLAGHAPMNVMDVPRVISPCQCTPLLLSHDSGRTSGVTEVRVAVLGEIEKNESLQVN